MTYLAIFDGEVRFNPLEIDEVKFWSADEIEAMLGKDLFTPNFEEEWGLWLDWSAQNPGWLLLK